MSNAHNLIALCKYRFEQADEFVQQIRAYFESMPPE